MPRFNPLRSLFKSMQGISRQYSCRSRRSVDVIDTSRPGVANPAINTQALRANSWDLDMAARGRFDRMASPVDSTRDTPGEKFKRGLERWANQAGISSDEAEERQTAKSRLLEAYKNNSTQLSLSDLGLTSLPREIGQLTALKQVDLYGNQLSRLPAAIGQLTALESLQLYDNSLTHLPDEIRQLTALKDLSLQMNELSQLPSGIEQLTALETLNMSNNQFTHIDINSLPQTNRLQVNLQDNRFSSATVDALNNTQNQTDYSGPSLALSAVRSQQTHHITAANIKEVMSKLGHDSRHPLWAALEKRSEMGNVANDFTLLLAKLYNQAPKQNHQLAGRISQHIKTVLSTLEALHTQAKTAEIEDILNNAHDAVATCVDRGAIHLLLMSAKSEYHQSRDQQAMEDFKTIHATIQFVARLYKNDEHKLVFDNESETFKGFFEMGNDNYKDFSQLASHDEVEDVLKLLNNGLLQKIDGCDMRFEACSNLQDSRYITAAKQFIASSLRPDTEGA